MSEFVGIFFDSPYSGIKDKLDADVAYHEAWRTENMARWSEGERREWIARCRALDDAVLDDLARMYEYKYMDYEWQSGLPYKEIKGVGFRICDIPRDRLDMRLVQMLANR
jgi:hypothetical protein